MARHVADPLGDPAGDEHASVVVAVRPFLQRVQLDLRSSRDPAGGLARQSLLGALLRDPGQHLGRITLLHDHVSCGAQVSPRAVARSGGNRWSQLVSENLVHQPADDAEHYSDYGAVLADCHLREFRHRQDPDEWRTGRSNPRFRHLGLHLGDLGQRHSTRCLGIAVYGANPGDRRILHLAQRAPPWKRGMTMTTATATGAAGQVSRVRYGSISRGRRRTLFWSYFFLILFVIFFLTPPVYMFITSLKSSAEISAATNPWWVYHPTLSNYIELLTQKTYLIFFRNSAVVSICVVSITMVISVLAAFSLARMKFWGSATLATGVFLAYLIPDSLLFIPLFKTFAYIHDKTGIELINHWWVLIILYPTLTVPFCTWIMIGYFSSIPKELDEAALIDGAGYIKMLTKIFIPVALPGIIAATIFTFTVSWANFLYGLAFTTSADQLTLPVGIVTTLIRGDVYAWGQIMTGALLGAAPPLIIYAFLMDYYIAGLTAGATKG